jgi:hypothetical protein
MSAGSAPLFGDAVEEFFIQRARLKGWKGGIDGGEADRYRRTLIGTSFAEIPIGSITTAESALNSIPAPAATAEKTRPRVLGVVNGRRRWAIVSLRRTLPAVVGLLRAVPKANIAPLSPGRKCHCSCASSNARFVAGKSLAMDHWTTARAGETLGATRSEIKSSKEFAPIAGLATHLVEGEPGSFLPNDEGGKKSATCCYRKATLRLTAGYRRPFSRSWGQMLDLLTRPRARFMAFDRVSRIGRRNAVTRKTFAKWHWLTPLAMPWGKPIATVRRSIAGAKLWVRGLVFAAEQSAHEQLRRVAFNDGIQCRALSGLRLPDPRPIPFSSKLNEMR